MAKSPKKKSKRNPKRKTDEKLIRELFPKEVLNEIVVQLKDVDSKRDN